MAEKVVESLLLKGELTSKRIVSATHYYNGISITTSAIGYDMAAAEEAVFVVNIGTVSGLVATLKNSILHSQTNDPTTASLLTGASFTDVVNANTAAIQIGSVKKESSGCERYLFLDTEAQGTPITMDVSAVVLLRGTSGPAANTVVFDL